MVADDYPKMSLTAGEGPIKKRRRRRGEPYAWLGAGAITLGVGAALAGGAGVAQADSTGTGSPSSDHTSRGESTSAVSSDGSRHPRPSSEAHGKTARHPTASAVSSGVATTLSSRVATRRAPGTAKSARLERNTAPIVLNATSFASEAAIPTADVTHGRIVAGSTAPALTRAATANVNAITSLVAPLITALVNLFGVNTPTAPNDPIGGLLWGFFRGLNNALGLTPKATSPTMSAPDPSTGTVTGNWGFTQPAGLSMTYTFTGAAAGEAHVYTNGTFTYTPSADARAAATDGTTDSFTITAYDAVATTTQTIVVKVLPLDKPVAGTPTVSNPDPVTGVVTGTLGFTDPGGKALSYNVSAGPSKGAVVVTEDGHYTYTPTEEARRAATADTTDNFTVTASNGIASTGETVTVPVSPLGGDGGTAGPGTIADAGGTSVAITPNGSLAYVLSERTVSVIDTHTNTVIKTISILTSRSVTGQVLAVNPTGDTVYVIDANLLDNYPGGSVQLIDVATNTLSRTVIYPVGSAPDALAFNGSGTRAYVVATREGALEVIDTSTKKVIDEIDIGWTNYNDYRNTQDSLAIVGGTAYLVGPSNTVQAINTATRVVTNITVPGAQWVVAGDDGKVFVYSTLVDSNRHAFGELSVIDSSINEVSDPVVVTAAGESATGLAISPDGRYVYIAIDDGEESTLAVYEVAGATFGDRLSVPDGWRAGDVLISPDNRLAYILATAYDGTGTALQVIATGREQV